MTESENCQQTVRSPMLPFRGTHFAFCVFNRSNLTVIDLKRSFSLCSPRVGSPGAGPKGGGAQVLEGLVCRVVHLWLGQRGRGLKGAGLRF